MQFLGVQESPGEMFRRLAFYSLLMIFFPLASYFVSKTIFFEGLFGMTSSNSYFYAAIVAIVAVHIFLAIFIYIAFMEGAKPARKRD
jgi:hypothetical protein